MLSIRNLRIKVGVHDIVHIDEFSINAGQRVGLVGESGSGKSLTAASIIGLQPSAAQLSGSIRFEGCELLGLSDLELARVRGAKIGFVPQDPTRALNPTMRIGSQVEEALRLSTSLSKKAIKLRAIELLEQVQLPSVEALAVRFPHQISGGQQQRVLIAMAIAARPRLLIADEPTTALDVTVQNEILHLILDLSTRYRMSLLFISHELGVVRSVCEDIGVVYGGQLVEVARAKEIISRPRHRYTQALMRANPGLLNKSSWHINSNRRLPVIKGAVPTAGNFPSGCRFCDRCDYVLQPCMDASPSTRQINSLHTIKCWNPVEYEEWK